jgi:hypothetical protein
MRVGFSQGKRTKNSGGEFTANDPNNSPTAEPESSFPSLSDLCITKIAKLLFQSREQKLRVKLPTELRDRILQSLAKQNFLNNFTLIPFISYDLVSLDLTNNDRGLHPFHPQLIDDCLKVGEYMCVASFIHIHYKTHVLESIIHQPFLF